MTERSATTGTIEEPHYGYSSISNNMEYFLLAGDVGGTNIRLAIYDTTSDSECNKPIYYREYLNSVYITDSTKTFEDNIIEPFLKNWYEEHSDKKYDCNDPEASGGNISMFSCFAVAGPVEKNCATMTNLKMTHRELCTTTDCEESVILFCGNKIAASNSKMLSVIKTSLVINDFVGQGYGCLDLDLDTEVIELTPNSKAMIDPTGPKFCIGAGTGLGECFLTPNGDGDGSYTCFASEGGHVDFAPRTALQFQLLQYLQDKFKSSEDSRISVERVVSGKGLANVYEFLSLTFPDRIVPKVHEEFLDAGDMQGKVVGVNANVEPSFLRSVLRGNAYHDVGVWCGSGELWDYVYSDGWVVCSGWIDAEEY